MIKKLRRRFIRFSSSVLLAVLVLALLITCGCFTVYLVGNVRDTLNDAMMLSLNPERDRVWRSDEPYTAEDDYRFAWSNKERTPQKAADEHDEEPQSQSRLPVFLFQYLSEGTVYDNGRIAQEGDLIQLRGDRQYLSSSASWDTILQEILATGEQQGRMPAYHLCYLLLQDSFGTRIALVDYTVYAELAWRVAMGSVIVFLALLVIFMLLILWMSKWLVLPTEKALEKQRRFMTDASHEIKTPLTVLLSTAELPETADHDERERRVTVIREESQRMRELVEEMLDTASLEARAKTAAVMRVDLSNVTTEYALQYEALFYENGVTFNSEIQGKVFVLGDPQLTERLVRTLLDNAYKYTPKGGRAEVRLHATKKQAELLVTNTGIGIQKDDLELIFERFYRSDATRTHLEGGYGLGLSIAKSTAESMKGAIWCESDGATFVTLHVQLPRAKS